MGTTGKLTSPVERVEKMERERELYRTTQSVISIWKRRLHHEALLHYKEREEREFQEGGMQRPILCHFNCETPQEVIVKLGKKEVSTKVVV